MGIMVYSLIWVMQHLYHQPYVYDMPRKLILRLPSSTGDISVGRGSRWHILGGHLGDFGIPLLGFYRGTYS